jgi:radical SAM superfamily enzyme YgiQ (UPF0313 family)
MGFSRFAASSAKLRLTLRSKGQPDHSTSECKHLDHSGPVTRAPNALLVFPRFNPNNFWNVPAVCEVWGARCPGPPLGLITLAALLPPAWNVRLINRNSEELATRDLDWADIVMTGGMLSQRADTLSLIELCHAHRKSVVVGGPDAMSSPEVYRGADFLVLGEAEGLIDRFIEAWAAGARGGLFEGAKFAVDVTTSPVPRFDLLKLDHYLYIGVQFSRGCPLNCEFCDIIELYGRVPRAKSNEQMLAELDALYRTGYRGHVDFVDDNLIGNKKALKRLLPALCDWQRQRRYPFKFSTEASINLADDPALLQMMREANFFSVFVGIESPDTDTLIATQKKQNTRRSLADSVHRIYAAGMFVSGGFIIGFDSEKGSVAQAMVEAIEATSIPVCMVGLLNALPNTQLARRLEREGRILPIEVADHSTSGLNFVTLRPRRDILADLKTVWQSIYTPAAFFGRVRKVCRALERPHRRSKLSMKVLRSAGRIAWYMTVRGPELRRQFWTTLIGSARAGNIEYVWMMGALYMHAGDFAKFVIKDLERQFEMLDAKGSARQEAISWGMQLAPVPRRSLDSAGLSV